MKRIRSEAGKKNLIGQQLAQLRQEHHLSQQQLAKKLQLEGYDLDKNAIFRIEHYQRFVSDIELQGICNIFQISADDLLKEK